MPTTTSQPIRPLVRFSDGAARPSGDRTHPAYQQGRGFTLPLAPLNGGRKRSIAPSP